MTEEKQLTEVQQQRWDIWNHPNCVKGRHDRIYNEDGTDKLNHYGAPRKDYITKIEAMTIEELESETESMIYMDALTAQNRRPTDWAWQCDACYDELMRRTQTDEVYAKCHKNVSRSQGY